MNIHELIELLPMHPANAFENGLYKPATENSFYLYEIHHMSAGFYDSHVWIFNSIEEFVDFLPAIVFNDIAVNWESYLKDDDHNYDYSGEYEFFESLIIRQWDFQQCVDFVENHKIFGELEIIEFGKIADLISVSAIEFDKCKEYYNSLEKLKNLGLTQGRYQIFNKFHQYSEEIPSKNVTLFLELIDEWGLH